MTIVRMVVDEIGTNSLVIVVLLLALYSAFTYSLPGKIRSFRWQTLTLFLLALLTTFVQQDYLFVVVASILFLQFFSITPLMAFVTNFEGWRPDRPFIPYMRELMNVREAQDRWLEYNPEHNPDTGKVRSSPLNPLIRSVVLIIIAYFVAARVVGSNEVRSVNGLGASLALLFIGLFIMLNAYDILSQTMGLLIMENGLFLAAVIVITNPNLIIAFLFSMFAAYTITLAILIIILPQLRRSSRSIYVKDQKVLKE